MSDTITDEPKKASILVVDDIPKNLQVLVNILRKENYKIAVATNGKQALEMISRFVPDLILLDIMMPEMDGFDVCQSIKSNQETKSIPIIFLTAKTDTRDLVRGFEVGAVDYVTKPFNRAELLARVNTHLDIKRSHEAIVKLEQKNSVLAMALTANHEINQPLTVLQGNFDLFQRTLQRDQLSEKQQNFLSKMQISIEKIQSILRKFTESESIAFKEYLEEKKMVEFK